ncbi:MAG: four helix bundle protein [Planctomycetaceae bacterium]|nr:four helix bundle protein [Planctomycetaceae bacterium]
MEFRFEKLDVWHLATELAMQIYVITKSFPNEERFGLTSQVRRSAISISANIAEGSGRVSDKDFSRFLEIAYGSLMETISHLLIAHKLLLISDQQLIELKDQSSKLGRMLSGLRRSLNK